MPQGCLAGLLWAVQAVLSSPAGLLSEDLRAAHCHVRTVLSVSPHVDDLLSWRLLDPGQSLGGAGRGLGKVPASALLPRVVATPVIEGQARLQSGDGASLELQRRGTANSARPVDLKCPSQNRNQDDSAPLTPACQPDWQGGGIVPTSRVKKRRPRVTTSCARVTAVIGRVCGVAVGMTFYSQ